MNDRFATPRPDNDIRIAVTTADMPPRQEETLQQVVGETNGLLGDLWCMIGEIKDTLFAMMPEEKPNADKAPACAMNGMICARQMVKACCGEAMEILRRLKS
ncbi:MAG: hypothetical protein J6S60_03945 [Oscillospiraceae bacterium]|nr:hypothetical protein [Oscillospiraceae bacterium]